MTFAFADELRELLERYPGLEHDDLARLRSLYKTASAAELRRFEADPEIQMKLERLDLLTSQTWARIAAVALFAAISLLAIFTLLQIV